MQYIPMIPRPIYPHSDPKEEHFALEDRRRFADDLNDREEITFWFQSINDPTEKQIVNLYNQLVKEMKTPMKQLTEYLVKQFDEPGARYLLAAQNAKGSHGGAARTIKLRGNEQKGQALIASEAVIEVQRWVAKVDDAGDYANFIQKLREDTYRGLPPQSEIKLMVSPKSWFNLNRLCPAEANEEQLKDELEKLQNLLDQLKQSQSNLQKALTRFHLRAFESMKQYFARNKLYAVLEVPKIKSVSTPPDLNLQIQTPGSGDTKTRKFEQFEHTPTS